MSIEKRLEKLEANTTGAKAWETPMYLRVYLKHLENHRREEAGKPPIPLKPEEERYERETENDPELRAYFEKIDKQIEEYEFE